MFEKIEVNGQNAHPLYNFLRANSVLRNEQTGQSGRIPWNFTKFLCGRNGIPFKRYGPTTAPSKMEPDILALLDKD